MGVMRRTLKTIAICACLATSPAFAQSVQEVTRAQIEAQGFEVYNTGRTWLGRLVFHARNADFTREVVVSRGSGEILHDVWTPLSEMKTPTGREGPPEPGAPGKGEHGPGPGPGGPGGGAGGGGE